MKKRMGSLLLAIVMLFSAVPMLVLSVGAEEDGFTASFKTDMANITTDALTDVVTYGDWYPAVIDNGTPVKMDYYLRGTHNANNRCYMTKGGYDSLLLHPTWGAHAWGGTTSSAGCGVMRPETGYLEFSNARSAVAYVYEMTQDGRYSIAPRVEDFIAPEEGKAYYFGICVNENLVWPVYGATWQCSATSGTVFSDSAGVWYEVTSATTEDALNEALSTAAIVVEQGDRVEFVYRHAPCASGKYEYYLGPKMMPAFDAAPFHDKMLIARENGNPVASYLVSGDTVILPEWTNASVFLGWDTNGDGMVDAQPGATFTPAATDSMTLYVDAVTIPKTSLMSSFPGYDESKETVIWNGGWQVGNYDTTFWSFRPYTVRDSFGIICFEGNCWGSGGGLYTQGNNKGKFAIDSSMPTDNLVSAILYTAAYNGTVELGYDDLRGVREGARSPDHISFSYAIYKNDEKIWPKDQDYFTYKSDAVINEAYYTANILPTVLASGDFPLTVDVAQGDVISFRTQQGSSQAWMMYIDPTVTYTALSATPSVVGSGVTLGADLSLDVYVDILGGDGTATAVLEYWESEPTEEMLNGGGKIAEGVLDAVSGQYIFTIPGLSAKQMSQMFYVRPTAKADGNFIRGGVAAVSVQQYADKAIAENPEMAEVLRAMLSYGAAAQTLFRHNVENLANGNIAVTDRPTNFDTGALVNSYAQGEGDNAIKSVSLLFEDRLGFKFMIDSVEGATTYELEVADNAAFTDSRKIPMTAAWEGREQKAIVDVAYSGMDSVLYVRAVVDGQAGAPLTYSFDSYYARMEMTASDNLYMALSALANFDRALRAYLA